MSVLDVIDGFMGFLKTSGIEPDRFQYRWDVPEDPLARAWAEEQLPDGPPIVVISPCAGNPERNWRNDRYARVADHLAETHGVRVVVTCSKELEQVKFTNEMCARMQHPPINMAGRTNLQQLLAILRPCPIRNRSGFRHDSHGHDCRHSGPRPCTPTPIRAARGPTEASTGA